MALKIDVFNHIFPRPLFERLQKVIAHRGPIKRWLNIPFLHDLDGHARRLTARVLLNRRIGVQEQLLLNKILVTSALV